MLFVIYSVGMLNSKDVVAVVGGAERFDEFKEEELNDFQNILLEEEKLAQLEELDKLNELEEEAETSSDGHVLSEEEIKLLKEEILALPDIDRFQFELNGYALYSDNIDRGRPRYTEGDSQFSVDGTTLINLSGRKTDLRLDLSAGKNWNIKSPTKDLLFVEERLRLRRKFMKKLTQSLNSKIGRTTSKTIEVNSGDRRIRWDSVQASSWNYAITKRLAVNLDTDLTHRQFTTEAFDQDSEWQSRFASAIHWYKTPKSRFQAGYSLGLNRVRSVGLEEELATSTDRVRRSSRDTNSHDLSVGYFGKLTRKSSVSFNAGLTRQIPQPDGNVNKGYSVGLGFLYTYSPKTQLTLQFIHQIQNTTSDAIAGTENDTTQTDTHFTHDNLSLAVSHKLSSKFSHSITATMSHLRNDTISADEMKRVRQFTFPITYALNYDVTRWCRLKTTYTYAYRTGNEKDETFISNLWRSDVALKF